MKKNYFEPELDIFRFQFEDILTPSTTDPEEETIEVDPGEEETLP